MLTAPLFAKALQCKVKQVSDDTYDVHSPSGRSYKVTMATTSLGYCSCPWGMNNGPSLLEEGCSHMIAVYMHKKAGK